MKKRSALQSDGRTAAFGADERDGEISGAHLRRAFAAFAAAAAAFSAGVCETEADGAAAATVGLAMVSTSARRWGFEGRRRDGTSRGGWLSDGQEKVR
jgi:hypothetical protein